MVRNNLNAKYDQFLVIKSRADMKLSIAIVRFTYRFASSWTVLMDEFEQFDSVFEWWIRKSTCYLGTVSEVSIIVNYTNERRKNIDLILFFTSYEN